MNYTNTWDSANWDEGEWKEPDPVPLLDRNNLSDLASVANALTNLGAGDAGKEVFRKDSVNAIREYLGVDDFPIYLPYVLMSIIRSYDNVFDGKNRFNITTGKQFEIRKDPRARNYDTSRASFVIQHSDEQDAGFNALHPATVTSIYNDNDGWVDGPYGLSMTIWTGNYTYVTKKGNGSAQGYTVGGELGACSAYNELGAFQAVLSANGTTKGYLSLFEGLVQDTPDGGAHKYRTRMAGAALRVSKHHPNSDPSSINVWSSEGPLPVDGGVIINNLGNQLFKTLIDGRGATITTGQAYILPNNTSIAWENSAKTNTSPTVWMDGTDSTRVAAGPSGWIFFCSAGPAFTPMMAINTNDPANPLYLVVNGALVQIVPGAPNSGGPGRRALTIPN